VEQHGQAGADAVDVVGGDFHEAILIFRPPRFELRRFPDDEWLDRCSIRWHPCS
jgi:hypothetical protein